MRNLLDRFIRADEAETIIPATADFSFLDLLTADSNTDEAVAEAERQAGSTRAAAEKIAAKDRSVINDWNNRDRALSTIAKSKNSRPKNKKCVIKTHINIKQNVIFLVQN